MAHSNSRCDEGSQVARLAGLIGLFCFMLNASAASQTHSAPLGRWALGVSLGVSSFSGVSEGTGENGERLSFTPYRPTMWGIAAAYGARAIRGGLTVRYGQAGLGIRGSPLLDDGEPSPPVLIIAENTYHVSAITAGLSTQLLRLRGGPFLRPSVAFAIEHWTAPGTPARTIAGGQAGLALEIILTRALVGTVEGELGLTPASPFRAEDLPEGYRLRSAWRRTLSAGVYWRF
jgi:hypothetical protein